MHQAFRLTFLFRRLVRNVVLIGTVTTLILITGNARGEWAEVNLTPEVFLTEKHEDQFTFTRDSFSVWETQLRARLKSQIKSDRWLIDVNNEYRGSRYVVHDELNRDDWKSDLSSEFKTENLLWGLAGGYEKDHPSSADADTDQDFNRITRNRWNIGPTLSWSLSDLTTLQATYSYSDTSFQDDEPTRDDYHVHSASLSAFRFLRASTQVFSRFSYVGFFLEPRIPESPVIVSESDAKTEQLILQAGINHAFSETFNVSISGGNNWLFSKQTTGESLISGQETTNRSKQTEFIANLGLTKHFELSTLEAIFDRSVFPTFSGGQTERNQITLKYTHRLSNTLKAHILADAYENRTLEDVANSESDRNRYTGEVRLNWQFAEKWELVGQYRYRYEDRKSRDPEDINTVFLSVRYRWSPLTLFP